MVTLVLLPGMDGTGLLFSEFIDALGPEVESIVVSYPTDQPQSYSDLETIARSFLPVNKPFVLLGESFSGPIAISIAASCPQGLVGLILCCSFARNPLPWLGGFRSVLQLLPIKLVPIRLLGTLLLGRFSTAKLQCALRHALALVSLEVLRTRTLAVFSVDVSAQLSQIRIPVLYLRALEDRLVPRASYNAIARLLHGIRLIELEGPHFLLQALPFAMAGIVRGFMRELASYCKATV